MNRKILSRFLSILLVFLIVSTCIRSEPTPLTIEVLKNTEYQVEYAADGKAKLTNGIYREKIVPDSATELIIRLGDQYAIGDLNGDGAEDAAAILVSDPGGSGTFRDLAVVINQNGTYKNVATEFLGDRIKVNSISIKSGEIVIEMLKQGPGDPMFRPTLNVIQTYVLEGNKIWLLTKNRYPLKNSCLR